MIYNPVLSNAQPNQIKEETMVTKTLAIPNPSALNLAGPDISIDVDNMNSNAVLEYIADQGGYDIVFVKSNPTYTTGSSRSTNIMETIVPTAGTEQNIYGSTETQDAGIPGEIGGESESDDSLDSDRLITMKLRERAIHKHLIQY